MEPGFVLIASSLAALGVVALLVLWKGRRRAPERLEVVFELRLPSRWAAELTAQTLENDDIRSRIQQTGRAWTCYVTRPMGSDRSQIESTCRRLGQVAAARGGGCVAHRVTLGGRRERFEH